MNIRILLGFGFLSLVSLVSTPASAQVDPICDVDINILDDTNFYVDSTRYVKYLVGYDDNNGNVQVELLPGGPKENRCDFDSTTSVGKLFVLDNVDYTITGFFHYSGTGMEVISLTPGSP